jgi:predicted MFS family arabinose efflux permease
VADAPGASGLAVALAAGIGCAGLAAYVFWERTTDHPMTPPRLARTRVFVGLNLATLLIYAGLSIVFFLIPFDLIERRGLAATDAGLAFLPFTLGVGLLSRVFGGLADKIGARIMLVTGPLGAAFAYAWMAFSQEASLLFGVIGPMALLGLSFAILVAPLTASVMSSVEDRDQGLASGINNAASRIAQLAGVALASGVGGLKFGYELGLVAAVICSFGGAYIVLISGPMNAFRSNG